MFYLDMSLYIDMNFQSRLLEQVVVVEGSSSVLISKFAYLLRSNARFGKQIRQMLAFSMFMLKGFTMYSSAPIWSPSRMFFSSPSAVSSTTGCGMFQYRS